MTQYDIETREKIMNAAMQLIEQHGDIVRITSRDIAAKAGVGVGLINYHFQTKENLINRCVQDLISKVIGGFEPQYKSLEMEPLDKLRYLLKHTAGFLAIRTGISRISILGDYVNPGADDNSMQTIRAYTPVVREVMGDKADELAVFFTIHMLVSAIQSAFLRHEVISKATGLNFYDKDQRNALVDAVVDQVFRVRNDKDE